MPDFIIIGAQRSGTTSLHSYLSQHPQIIPPFEKEIHFFNGGLIPDIDNYVRGKKWYSAHFPLRLCLKPNKITFEATPLYLFNPLSAKRIFDLVPNVKIIALLRNPTERAISQYFHKVKGGRENLCIQSAFEKEEERINPLIRNKDYKNDYFIHFSYKQRGMYKLQIERYYRYFSKDQIYLLQSENFFTDPEGSLKRIFEFLKIESNVKIRNLKPKNVSKNRYKVPPFVYEYLNDFFFHHNELLYKYINEKFEW